MPWCPKCKTEYREGFQVCADCGSELVAEQPVEERKAPKWEAYEEDIPGVEPGAGFDWDAEGTANEAEENGEESEGSAAENRKEEAAQSGKSGKSGGLYQDSSERASENKSSAWILLILGILGLIVVVLGVTEVLPIHMGNSYLFYGVMGAIFILFVVSGIVSMKNAKFFEKKAESENSLRTTLIEWCKENLDAAEIDGKIGAQGVSDEVLYFRRFSYIKEKMNHQFMNLDQGFLDRFIDDYVYDSVFEGKSE